MTGESDYTELQRQRRFLAQATVALASSLDYNETLQRVANLAVPLLADSCAIHLVDDTGAITLVAATHIDPSKTDAMLTLAHHDRLNDSRVWVRAIREGRNILVPDIQPAIVRETLNDDPVLLAAFDQLMFTSQISVPLRARDRTLGGISLVLGPGDRRYGDEHVLVAEELARIAAIAVDNALLYREAQRERSEAGAARDRASFLAEVSAVVASSLELADTVRAAANLAVPALADFCDVLLLDNDRTLQIAVAHVDPVKAEMIEEVGRRHPLTLDQTPITAKVIAENRPILLSEMDPDAILAAAQNDFFRQVASALRPRSCLTVPLSARGRAVGAIALFMSESGRRFSEEDIPVATDFGRRIAIAIDNARLYEEAQESNRLKDDFLSVLSHELRTPLNAVLGWSRMLVTGQLDAAARAKAAESIYRNAAAQLRLVEDILDAARGLAGKLQVEPVPVDVVEIVDAAVAEFGQDAASKQVLLHRIPGVRSVVMSADPNRLRQLVANLLSNAIKFTPAGGRVEISVDLTDGHVEIQVRDTGIGIDGAFLPHVFERFRQADASLTRQYGGLGLGLAIVRQLVELHGGSVSAVSDGPGRGASFRVRLPVTDATTLRQHATPADQSSDATTRTRSVR